MTAARTTAFLVNPASAGGATGRRWPELARRAAAAGLDGTTYLSERRGQLPELACRAVAEGASLLVAVGGDGTVNEVVNGIFGSGLAAEVELAIISRGTGADFARTFGIPRSFDAAVSVVLAGNTRTVDVGRATYATSGGEATRLFANVAGAGMSGAIASRANATTKILGGKLSYLWATAAVFARWRARELEVEVDAERRAGAMCDVVVANGRYLAGGIRICPDAEPDDGRFDALLIGDVGKLDLAVTLPKAYRGRHLPHPKAELLAGATVTVRSDEPVPVQLDGEQPGTTPVRFEVVPGALRLRVR